MLAACWRVDEDRALCVENNLILRFAVEVTRAAADGPEEIDVFLFDEAGLFVDSRHAESSTEGELQVEFLVTPAVYHVVCWGNVDDARTPIRRNGTLNSSFVELASSDYGSQLYYAPGKAPAFENSDLDPHRVVVDGKEATVVELTFAKAHRTVSVYAVGFANARSEEGLAVEHAGACGRYDFMLQADPSPVVLRQSMNPELSRGNDIFAAIFTSMLHPLHGGEQIILMDAGSGEPLASVNLTEFVAANDIDDDSDIEIAFVYNELTAEVSVQLPLWSDNDIKPEL